MSKKIPVQQNLRKIIVQGKPWGQKSSIVLLLSLSCKESHGEEIERCVSALFIVQGKPWGHTSSIVLPLLVSCKGSHGDRNRALCFCYYYFFLYFFISLLIDFYSYNVQASPGPWGATWVNFCWVCTAGLSEPLPHYSLFFGQL